MSREFVIKTLEDYLKGGLSIREACEKLDVHRSTLWRMTRRYQEKGEKALEHGLKGRPSNHSKSEEFRKYVCDLYLSQYKPQGQTVLAFYNEVARTLPDYASYSTVLNWIRAIETQGDSLQI